MRSTEQRPQHYFRDLITTWLGIGADVTSHTEKLISGLGALLGLLAVYQFSQWYLGPVGASMMVASMGATAVLLFAVPHGALSQPWSVVGGHAVSAVVGVACQQWFGGAMYTSALAVGLAVTAMHYLRCIHPPGGATALIAVIGGADIHALGYQYALTPVLLNVASMLLVAVLFNGLFKWRRYPAHLAPRHTPAVPPTQTAAEPLLTHEDLAYAMEQINTYIDVTSEDLADLFELALEHAQRQESHPQQILVGGYYSNGQTGADWCIRQVIDASTDQRLGREQLIYKNVAGHEALTTGTCSTEEFQRWARFPVRQQGNLWVRLSVE